MPANHDLDSNASSSKPFRSSTSARTSTEVDCEDQRDDQLQQGKREGEDQKQGQRKREAPFRDSRSLDWRQEEGCHTNSAIGLTGEGFSQMNETDSDPSTRAKLFECHKDIASLKKALLQEAENHSNVTYELHALRRAVSLSCHSRQVMNPDGRTRRFGARNILLAERKRQLFRENNELVEKNNQLVGENNQLVGENNQLVEKNNQLVGKNNQLVGEYHQLVEKNNQLVGENNQLVEKNIQLVGRYGSCLGQSWSVAASQRTIQLIKERIEHYESSAREKDEEIRQRGSCVEGLKKTIQETNYLTQQLLEVNKQQQETNKSLTRMIGEMLELGNSQQKTNTALVKLLREMDARNREQDKYIYQSYEPIKPTDGSLPVIHGPDLSAPPASFATNQQQTPVQASSPHHVNFGPSYIGQFAYTVSSPQTPTLSPISQGQVCREGILEAPFVPVRQAPSWPDFSRY